MLFLMKNGNEMMFLEKWTANKRTNSTPRIEKRRGKAHHRLRVRARMTNPRENENE